MDSYVTAFTGTNLSSTEVLKDVVTDATIVLGNNRQSEQAYIYLNELMQEFPNAYHQLTGHSLGMGIAYDMAVVFHLDVIGFNGAPGSISVDLLSKYQQKKYDREMINFVMKNDVLYIISRIAKNLGLKMYANQNNYVLNGKSGHDISHFMDKNILMQMQTILNIRNGIEPEKIFQTIPLDINNDGIADFTMVSTPDKFIAYNLLAQENLVSQSKQIQINPQSLKNLTNNLRTIISEDFVSGVEILTKYSIAKNKNMKSMTKQRIETAELSLLDRFQETGFAAIMQQLGESLDNFVPGTEVGEKNRLVLNKIQHLNTTWLANYFHCDPGFLWRKVQSQEVWTPTNVVHKIKSLQEVGEAIQALILSQENAQVCYAYATKNAIQLAESAQNFHVFFTKLETKLMESLRGTGHRVSLEDGIADALAHVFEVMLENYKTFTEYLEYISVCAEMMSESFTAMDSKLVNYIRNKKLPEMHQIKIASTFDKFLQEYEIFDDMHVINARKEQVEIRAQEVSSYLLEGVSKNFEELQTTMQQFTSELNVLEQYVNEVLGEAKQPIEKVQMKKVMEENIPYGYNPLTNTYEDMAQESCEYTSEQIERTTLEQVCWEMKEIYKIKDDIIPLASSMSYAIGSIEGFLLEQQNIPAFVQKNVEQAIYQQDGMEDIMQLQWLIFDTMERIRKQLEMLQLDLVNNNESLAITYLSTLIMKARDYLGYMIEMTRMCFGTR